MYSEMMNFVKTFFDNSVNTPEEFSNKYPFRDRFNHSVRVYNWALRINSIEKGDEEVICIAAIFHDIGKAVNDDVTHGEVGAVICEDYLNQIGFPQEKTKRIVNAISLHQYKEDESLKLQLEDKILMDADLLDEVGALTAVWDSMATAFEPMPSYIKVYERLLKYYNKLDGKKINLKTQYGKKLYEERLLFLKCFLDNLKYELWI